MDLSPWKGECILVPWFAICPSPIWRQTASRRGELAVPLLLALVLVQPAPELVPLPVPAGRELPSLPKYKKKQGDFCCPGQLRLWGDERGSPRPACVRIGGGICKCVGQWAGGLSQPCVPAWSWTDPAVFLPSPTKDAVGAWCSNRQRPGFQGTVTLSERALKLFTKWVLCKC